MGHVPEDLSKPAPSQCCLPTTVDWTMKISTALKKYGRKQGSWIAYDHRRTSDISYPQCLILCAPGAIWSSDRINKEGGGFGDLSVTGVKHQDQGNFQEEGFIGLMLPKG